MRKIFVDVKKCYHSSTKRYADLLPVTADVGISRIVKEFPGRDYPYLLENGQFTSEENIA